MYSKGGYSIDRSGVVFHIFNMHIHSFHRIYVSSHGEYEDGIVLLTFESCFVQTETDRRCCILHANMEPFDSETLKSFSWREGGRTRKAMHDLRIL
jgi:hypothetical protein